MIPVGLAERSDRFREAVTAIDAANADDPEVLVVDGVERPKEQCHAEMACHWVLELDPDATDEQLLAARAHHLRRWELPRSSYPEGRTGYLRWRTEQKKRHAALVGELLAAAGYDDDSIARVGSIIRKERLRTDPAVQTHEDALCLTFLDTQFGPVADQLGDDKMVDVLRKTMAKMSEAGLAMVGRLGLGDDAMRLIGVAAESSESDPD